MTYKRYIDPDTGLLTVSKDGKPFAVLEEPDAPIKVWQFRRLFCFRGKDICWRWMDVWWRGWFTVTQTLHSHQFKTVRVRPWLTSKKDTSSAPPNGGSTSDGRRVNSGRATARRRKE